ncbi:MAG: response regulator [Planctomycetaceae bacterium]|jgi:signal transduction histidine kinase/CheY-like chemotaxis protein|nr:response regulator [Planctomycetaceae bacterium]
MSDITERPEKIQEETDKQFVIADPGFFYVSLLPVWTLFVAGLLCAFLYYSQQEFLQILRSHAQAVCDRDLLFRAWNVEYGGIYAPIKESVLEPNLYLEHPKRDLTGRVNIDDPNDTVHLTLINPAWMTRQVNEMQKGDDKHQTLSRLTSSRLLNPNNAPKGWEKEALELIESKKETEFFQIGLDDNGIQRACLARPLYTARGCLACHGTQGYQEGDVRGMITLAVYNDTLFASRKKIQRFSCGVAAAAWLIGCVGLLFYRRSLHGYFRKNQLTLQELHKSRSDLRKHRDELEVMVANRTKDLVNAIQQAEAANHAKSQFLAHMSHEIRTPLNGVIGLSNLLKSEDISKKQAEYVEMILRSGETLLSQINDILDFSKIEAGMLDLDHIEFDLLAQFDSVISVLATRFLGNGVELCLDVGTGVPRYVIGDSKRFLQIILNFAGNAAKFTASGGVRLSAELLERKDCTAVIQFRIADTGIGIAKENISKLFDSYAQADVSISGRYGGTGLGLSIARSLILVMGGDITIKSEIGVGTTFEFYIPFPVSPQQETLVQKSAVPAAMPVSALPPLKGIRVLIADDNPVLVGSLREQLRHWDMDVETLADPADVLPAISKAAQDGKPFRLVIVDDTVQGESGVDIIEEMRRNDAAKDIPVLFLASLENDLSPAQTAELNISYLHKPCGVSPLFDTLMSMLFNVDFEVYFAEKSRRREASQKMLYSIGTLRFLVAEDNAVNQIVITEILRKAGSQCDVAPNGRRAVELYQENQYDVILMDCHMPEMDGYEATAEIRQMEKFVKKGQHIPIIALTANATKEDRSSCLGAGMDDYCSKPIKEDVLFNTIKRVLDSKKENGGT